MVLKARSPRSRCWQPVLLLCVLQENPFLPLSFWLSKHFSDSLACGHTAATVAFVFLSPPLCAGGGLVTPTSTSVFTFPPPLLSVGPCLFLLCVSLTTTLVGRFRAHLHNPSFKTFNTISEDPFSQ